MPGAGLECYRLDSLMGYIRPWGDKGMPDDWSRGRIIGVVSWRIGPEMGTCSSVVWALLFEGRLGPPSWASVDTCTGPLAPTGTNRTGTVPPSYFS